MKLKKMPLIYAVLTCLLFALNVFADSQESFVRKVEGGGSVSQSIQTTDGSYAYFNLSSITKLNNITGKKISEVSLSFDAQDDGYAYLDGMAQTSNGFILVGSGRLSGYYGISNGILVKIDSDGRIQWTKTFTVSGDINFHSVIPTTDGGFIVTGGVWPHDYHPVLIKFSSVGDIVWRKSFDNLSWHFQSKPTLDGGIILAAGIFQNDQRVIGTNIIKINGSGNVVWAVTLEMVDFSFHSLTSLSNNGLLIAGIGKDPNTLLLVYLNPDGTVRSKVAFSLNFPPSWVSSLAQTPDGGVAIGGDLYNKSGSAYDGFLLKLNDSQKLTFLKRLGFRNNEETIASVIAKEDGSYLLFGSTGKDTFFVGLNSDGLAPGCSFSHDLSASKVPFGKLKHQKLTLTTSLFGLTSGGSLKVKSKRLNRPISDACGNSQSSGGCL